MCASFFLFMINIFYIILTQISNQRKILSLITYTYINLVIANHSGKG